MFELKLNACSASNKYKLKVMRVIDAVSDASSREGNAAPQSNR